MYSRYILMLETGQQGSTEVFRVQPHCIITCLFLFASAAFYRKGTALHIQQTHAAHIILSDFFLLAPVQQPRFVFADGVAISSFELLQKIKYGEGTWQTLREQGQLAECEVEDVDWSQIGIESGRGLTAQWRMPVFLLQATQQDN